MNMEQKSPAGHSMPQTVCRQAKDSLGKVPRTKKYSVCHNNRRAVLSHKASLLPT